MIINQEDVMYIIAGLGNPGKEYMGTRHNAGFSVIDELADKYNISVDTILMKRIREERHGRSSGLLSLQLTHHTAERLHGVYLTRKQTDSPTCLLAEESRKAIR